MVSAFASRGARIALARFLCLDDIPEKYTGTRIIFKDFEPSNWSWDPVAKAYYWHRFFSHQPDLNFDNPLVQRAVIRTLDFWAEMGVDGFRLDAIPYLYEREGTNCENLPETHAFLKELRPHMDESYPNRMFLAEANMWPEDAVAYFGDGRRVPNVVPLPANAATVHGTAAGGPAAHRRDSEADSAHPGDVPMGAVPAQP